ncbi:ATP-binding protein [Pseudomonas sp. SDI]|uniref:ATP-binding protein n=1 Tax=Pseudomonas sp. SDI TaxID=2170734 RepID=UPI001057B61C|nr:ATP-binding protein [Pseudomonas sp. SDI]
MGVIRTEVLEQHLKSHPKEKDILLPFLDGFDVTWGRRTRGFNTEVSIFFLSPEPHYKESYGFENEILLIYSPFQTMEPRTLQAVEQIFSAAPAKGRVETLNYFLVSDDENVAEWLDSFLSSRQEARIIVPFSISELDAAKGDNWFVRNRLNQKFFGRDLFNYSLPLVEDTYFFGRQSTVMEYYDSIRRSENKAIFGLRKTGKTSLLFKIKRLCESEKVAAVFYVDCKQPHIRKARWFELLEDLAAEISQKLNALTASNYTERHASRSFVDLIKSCKDAGHRISIMFDEIEYISFISPRDKHWRDDYIELWQTLWSSQSQFKCLSFIIAGVNPSVVESDLVDGVQNPLFGIVPHKYLTGFSQEESRMMLRKLGKRMGMAFEFDACNYIRDWYGGHPLLIRQACSTLNSFMAENMDHPFKVDVQSFEGLKSRIDQELTFYSNHAISEIREFYPDEYYLFELLATGRELEFKELSRESAFISHLCSYQLIRKSEYGYEVNIPVIAQRVALDSMKKDGRELLYPLIDIPNRNSWLQRRIEEISTDFGVLERLISQGAKSCKLFGANSFPEGVRLHESKVVRDKDSFSVFINTLNRCFVESVEKYGVDLGNKQYFWNDVKAAYESLWPVLHRIKVYRNDVDHLHLNNATTKNFFEFLDSDFEGKQFSQISEPYFLLQQRLLDRLLLALQREIESAS